MLPEVSTKTRALMTGFGAGSPASIASVTLVPPASPTGGDRCPLLEHPIAKSPMITANGACIPARSYDGKTGNGKRMRASRKLRGTRS
ncbi:MAG: hypothetical protein IPJ61_21280 [Tessaracoccus sp.]|uniref:hypothetical protein n=1 Tax=Tessaracoccus sp. TaxID=1971211 RepID=UPI001EB95BF4|nr:hypothetical protein [Tessaracoccus sp.]MBK7823522.1 hypothetical protein [Tessaracoccus sp.]